VKGWAVKGWAVKGWAVKDGRMTGLAMYRCLMVLGVLALSGCGEKPPPPPELTLAIAAGKDQNPDTVGHPTPVAIRLFYLTATAKFERADVFALTEREKATLGEDSAGSEEFVLAPGETRSLVRTPKPGVQFLGVAVLFRDIDRAAWRSVRPVAAHGPTRLALSIDGLKATLGPGK